MRTLSSCTECPLQRGEKPIPPAILRKQLDRLALAARTGRRTQNRLRQLEHERKEMLEEIQRSDERVAKLEETQKSAQQAAETRLSANIALLQQQRESILALSAPVIQVWEGVLVLPMIGQLDEVRIQTLMDNVLSGLSLKQSRFAVLDLTGVPDLDEGSAFRILRLAMAVRLLGADLLLCGMQAHVARRLTELRIDLGAIQVKQTLKDALRYCIAGQR